MVRVCIIAAVIVASISVHTSVTAQESTRPLIGIPADADWSDLTREATLTQVATALARINEGYRTEYQNAVDAGAFLEPVFSAALDQIVALRDAVSSNPYVRVSSFTITAGLPPSVAVEFSFPPGVAE